MDYTTKGSFREALAEFKTCIQMVPLSYASSEEQEKTLRDLIKSCAEYITAVNCQIERQKQQPTVIVSLALRILRE